MPSPPIGGSVAVADTQGPGSDISWALTQFRDTQRDGRYRLARAYYFGDHPMGFAQNRFRTVFGALFQTVADNLCPAVVDSITDRLNVTGFQSEETELNSPISSKAWELWGQNLMGQRAQEIHREALMTGDGYAIVWPDPVTQRPCVWPQLAHEMAVAYDPDRPGVVIRAAKLWLSDEDRKLRLTLYYPDRIVRYQTSASVSSYRPDSLMQERAFEPIPSIFQAGVGDGNLPVSGTIPNPYGVVPVFHFPNKRYSSFGIGELNDVLPLQDALNKSVADMIVAMEFSSFMQRWVTGLEVGEIDEATGKPKHPPFEAGVDKIFASPSEGTKFGQFAATDLGQFLEVQENLRAEIARVSGTPLHYLFITKGDFPSGEAMKSAEARFTKKIVDRQQNFGTVWGELMKFCLRVDGSVTVPPDYKLEAQWEQATPYSEREQAESLLMKKALGVPMWQLFKEMGYDEPLIQKMLDNPDIAAAPGGALAPGSAPGDAALPAAKVYANTPDGPLRVPGQVITPRITAPAGDT